MEPDDSRSAGFGTDDGHDPAASGVMVAASVSAHETVIETGPVESQPDVDAALPLSPPSIKAPVVSEMFSQPATKRSPGHRTAKFEEPTKFPMLPFRAIAIAGTATAFALSGWQISRVIGEQPRLASLAWGSLFAGVIGAIGVVLWTFVVVENARRLIAPAATQEPPSPGHAASTWIVPMVFIGGAAAAVSYLSRKLNTPIEGTESSLPLLIAIVATLLALPLMYSPANYLSGVVRSIGGHGVKLGEWLMVPITLAIVGSAMIFGLRAGGAFGEDFDGIAPTWVVAVAAIVPAVVVVLLGWRAADAVETAVTLSFDRRLGTNSTLTTRQGKLSAIYADKGPNHAELRNRGHLRQIPGSGWIGVVITAGLAGLALLSVVGSLVMYLFWQEGRDGILLPAQSERAWDVVSTLRSVERLIAFGLIGVATIWTAMAVTNVRLASARRRNPLLAALTWPIAGAAIWVVGDRLVVDGTIAEIVAGFTVQAIVLYLPFAALERSSDAVGSRRNPFRLAHSIGVVLLVHIQGLGGLSNLSESAAHAEIGRLAGYLAIGALVQLLAMFAVTDATRSLVDAASHAAEHHNDLVDQRSSASARPRSALDPSVFGR